MLTEEEVRGLTGYDPSFIAALATHVNVEFSWVALIVGMLHSCMTYDAAASLTRFIVGSSYDERTVRRKFAEIGNALAERPLMNPTRRFMWLDKRFPNVTALVDCTTFPCRAKEWIQVGERKQSLTWCRHDNKDKGNCWKFEVITTLNGIPISVRGPVEGSIHDARVFCAGEPFPHIENEFFLADLGYVGCPHVVHGPKSNSKFASDWGSTTKQFFEKNIGLVRSRVERLFAWIDKHQSTHGSAYGKESAKNMALIIFNLEYLLGVAQSAVRYADDQHRIIPGEGREVPSPQEPWAQGTCSCGFRPTVESKKRTIKQIEETLLQQDRTGTWLPEDPKRPQKRGREPESQQSAIQTVQNEIRPSEVAALDSVT